MTDLLTPEDTGAVADTSVLIYPEPYLSVVDTARIPLDIHGRRALEGLWADAIHVRRPVATVRPVDTGELPVWPTGAEMVVREAPAGEASRPPGYRGVRRMPSRPTPRWAYAFVGAGLVLLAQSAVGAAMLLAVAR